MEIVQLSAVIIPEEQLKVSPEGKQLWNIAPLRTLAGRSLGEVSAHELIQHLQQAPRDEQGAEEAFHIREIILREDEEE